MSEEQTISGPAFVVLQQLPGGEWKMLGEFPRRGGLTARAARTQAVMEATNGLAKPGDVYAAVLRSEWRVGVDWCAPGG